MKYSNIAQQTWIAISSELMVWREIKIQFGQHINDDFSSGGISRVSFTE